MHCRYTSYRPAEARARVSILYILCARREPRSFKVQRGTAARGSLLLPHSAPARYAFRIKTFHFSLDKCAREHRCSLKHFLERAAPARATDSFNSSPRRYLPRLNSRFNYSSRRLYFLYLQIHELISYCNGGKNYCGAILWFAVQKRVRLLIFRHTVTFFYPPFARTNLLQRKARAYI